MTIKKDKYINSINLNNDTDFPYLVLAVRMADMLSARGPRRMSAGAGKVIPEKC